MLEKYYRLNKIAGVSIAIDADGNATFSACLLRIDGTQLSIESKIISIKDINELKKTLSPKTPIALNISGKGVLIKQTGYDKETSENVSVVLPNLNVSDFYIQNFTSGNQLFIAVIRISEAEKWLIKFENLGYGIFNLSLGPFVADKMLGQLNIYGQDLTFNGHIIKLNEQQEWLKYRFAEGEKSQFPYKLENEKLAEELIAPYASAFQLYLYPNSGLISADVPALKKQLDKNIEDKKVKIKGAFILAIVFILLLVNLALFSHYNAANASLATQVGQTETDANKTQLFADSIKIKKQLLDTLGWEGKIQKSILIDEVAQVLPTEIKWEQVAIDPVYTVAGTDNKQRFANRQLKITGISEKIIPVNEWLARLKTFIWVKDARLLSYTYSSELSTGQFVIIINY